MTTSTVFDAIVASLVEAARFNPEDQVAPTVILWTDNDRQWEPLVPRLQERLPALLVLGDYEADKRRGPAIWLRCAIARKLTDVQIPEDAVPILYGEQNLYSRSRELVGDRDPRGHEFLVQLRAFDAPRSGAGLGLAVLLGLCGALLQKSVKGGLAVAGALNLGGSIDPIHNAVEIAELAIDGRHGPADARRIPETAVQSPRRPGHEDRHPILPRLQGGAGQVAGRLRAWTKQERVRCSQENSQPDES